MLLTTIFYHVDNFCKELSEHVEKAALLGGKKQSGPLSSLSQSEAMTILIYFHHSGKRNFKDYYKTYIRGFLAQAFPCAPSYNRFIELIPRSVLPLYIFMNYCRLGTVTGISFIDSTSLHVCHNLRIRSNKVFKGIAARGKTSTGWFYGFKLHLVINERGEILAFDITAGNVDDRNISVIKKVTKHLYGRLFGDKGYISADLFRQLYSKGIRLFTRLKKKMQNMLLTLEDKVLLSKRGIIESVNDILKNQCQIEHTRHRSPINFLGHLVAGLVAYSFRDKKPSLKYHSNQSICVAK
jgi:hypothetical protein